MPRVEYCLLKRALTGIDEECGDAGVIRECGGTCFCALIDGVGHGREASQAATIAERYILEDCKRDLADMMNGMHARLENSRGAVAALCRLDIPTGKLRFVGIGNITVRILGNGSQRLISRDGIIGYMMARPKEQEARLHPGDVLMLTSDGIREHFDPDLVPGFLSGSARKIASDVLARFGKGTDDESCIILRYEE